MGEFRCCAIWFHHHRPSAELESTRIMKDSLFDDFPDEAMTMSSDEDFDETDQPPSAFVRVADACMELVSAVGDLSVAAGRGTLIAIGRFSNRKYLSGRHKDVQVRRMAERKHELQRIRAEEVSLRKVDSLERQLASLQAEFAKMINNSNNSSNAPAAFGDPMTPCTPQPPNTGPHSNPAPCTNGSPDLGDELDFLSSALDFIVAEQDQMEHEQEQECMELEPVDSPVKPIGEASDTLSGLKAALKQRELEGQSAEFEGQSAELDQIIETAEFQKIRDQPHITASKSVSLEPVLEPTSPRVA